MQFPFQVNAKRRGKLSFCRTSRSASSFPSTLMDASPPPPTCLSIHFSFRGFRCDRQRTAPLSSNFSLMCCGALGAETLFLDPRDGRFHQLHNQFSHKGTLHHRHDHPPTPPLRDRVCGPFVVSNPSSTSLRLAHFTEPFWKLVRRCQREEKLAPTLDRKKEKKVGWITMGILGRSFCSSALSHYNPQAPTFLCTTIYKWIARRSPGLDRRGKPVPYPNPMHFNSDLVSARPERVQHREVHRV